MHDLVSQWQHLQQISWRGLVSSDISTTWQTLAKLVSLDIQHNNVTNLDPRYIFTGELLLESWQILESFSISSCTGLEDISTLRKLE